jgi:hypothetical protein
MNPTIRIAESTRKKLVLLVLARVAVAATSVITPAYATTCPPNYLPVDCGGYTFCCYRFSVCICPA